MNCYFDTSIYNNILGSSDKDLVIQKIKDKHITAIPSLVNLCELLQTKDHNRKKKLLSVYHEVRDEFHALKPFTILLSDSTEALRQGNLYVEVNIPIAINEKTEQLCKEALKEAGKEFDAYALKARKWIFEEKGISTQPDVTTFLMNSHEKRMAPIWIDLFKGACDGMGIKDLNLNDDLIMKFITSPDSFWKYFLDAKLLIFYRRAMRREGYSRKSNPGGADLEQAIYLGWADIFVVQDNNFYNFMKELKDINNYRKEIFTFNEFKRFLGITIQDL